MESVFQGRTVFRAKGASPFSPGQRPGESVFKIHRAPTVRDTGSATQSGKAASLISQPVGPQIRRMHFTQPDELG
jgi:hypothetical protein